MPGRNRRGEVPPRFSRRRGLQAAAAAVAALGLLAGGGCGREPLHPRHVFLITVDTLRADHLSAYGYPRPTSPNLDRLAADSTFFARAITQWPKTGPAFAALFTGQYPLTTGLTHHAALHLPEGYLTLAEMFQEQGFTTLAVVSNGVLSTELGWNAGFDEFHETWAAFPQADDSPRAYRDTMNARRVNELAFAMLAAHRHDPRLFVWIHYSDPHTPYLLPPGVEDPFAGDALYRGDEAVEVENPGAVLFDGHQDLKFYVAQYDANVLLVDAEVHKLLAEATRLGLVDDTCVVFTADHGESLGEHDYYLEHGRLPYNVTAHVPLLIHETYRPRGGARIAQPVELVDLYPTLRDLVAPGKEVPGLEGKSLMPFLRQGGAALTPGQLAAFRYAFSQAGGGSPLTHFRSVQDRDAKLVYHPARTTKQGTVEPARWEYYDLDRDPGETVNLIASSPPALERLRQALSAWMGDRDWIYPPQGLAVSHSEQTLKALKALGYVN
jgi:arylsulfatase A-like enzyme